MGGVQLRNWRTVLGWKFSNHCITYLSGIKVSECTLLKWRKRHRFELCTFWMKLEYNLLIQLPSFHQLYHSQERTVLTVALYFGSTLDTVEALSRTLLKHMPFLSLLRTLYCFQTMFYWITSPSLFHCGVLSSWSITLRRGTGQFFPLLLQKLVDCSIINVVFLELLYAIYVVHCHPFRNESSAPYIQKAYLQLVRVPSKDSSLHYWYLQWPHSHCDFVVKTIPVCS